MHNYFILSSLLITSQLFAAPKSVVVPGEITHFIQDHCVRCHGPKKQKAKLRLDEISTNISDEAVAQQWQDLLDVLNLSEMPPEDEDQPNKKELQDTLETLTATLRDARERLTDTGGAVVIRRINNREYQNTIRDLFGIDHNVDMLPQDGNLDGFDTPGQAHSLSSLHIERYLSVGRKVLEQAYFPITGQRRKHGRVGRLEPEKKVNASMEKSIPKAKKSREKLIKDVADGKKYRATGIKTRDVEIPLMEEYVKRPERETGVLIPHRGVPGHISYPVVPWGTAPKGRYQMTVRFGLAGKEKHEDVFLKVVRGEPGSDSPDEVRYFNVTGTIDQPQEITFDFVADGVMSNHFYIRRRSFNDYRKKPFEKTEGYHWTYYRAAWDYQDTGPDIWVDWVEAKGPFPNEAPLAPKQLFSDKSFKDLNRDDIKNKVRTIAYHCFRQREPSESYIDNLMVIYDAAIDHGVKKHEAFFDAINPIIASPKFLFLFEPREGDERRALDDLELASRLSYFLWSSPPDAELYELAKLGKLKSPKVISSQIERMLQSEKVEVFFDAFVNQWLQLDRLSHVHPAQGAQPTYDDAVQRDSRREVLALFSYLLRNDESASAFVDANYVVVNQVMADFYNLPGVRGDAFQKVSLKNNSVRGGLLGQSAILALTGTGERTSPVERGVYVLRKILNRPPPPAPANVPMLDEKSVGSLSIRDTLSKHMNSPQCSSCHRRIDPLGYALENFDPVGLWRKEVSSSDGAKKFPVETDGVMPDGKRQFANFLEMKKHLVTDQDKFVSGLTHALMTYGFGRSIGFTDQTLIEEIVKKSKVKQHRLRSLLTSIILSEPFLTK